MKLTPNTIFLVALTAIFFSGCSSFSVTRLRAESEYSDGLRFYRPHPYLLQTQTDKGITSSIIYLPDKSEEYVLKHNVGLGVSNLKVTLENGWNLTSLGHDSDTKIPETITALTGALASLPTTGITRGEKSTVRSKSILYRLDFDPATNTVSSMTKVGEF